MGVWNSRQGRLGRGGEYRPGDSERDRLRDKPPRTGMRDAMTSVIMSLLAGAKTDGTVLGPERPRARMEEICPSRGPSKASVDGGSCFVTSPDAYRRYSGLKCMLLNLDVP